jgi:ribose transport system substrate-binding protein
MQLTLESTTTIFRRIVPVLSLCLALCSCDRGGAPTSTADKSTTRYKIGFANIAEDFSFPIRVQEGIQRGAKAAGNIDLIVADNRMDGATAQSNVESFITQGVNGIIEFQTDEKYGRSIMALCKENKIPVIAIDIPMEGAVFFGVNNYPAGHMAGEGLGHWIMQHWGGKIDELIMLELPQSGDIPAQRLRGQREGLESVIGKVPEDKVEHLDSKNTFEEAHRLMTDALTKLPDAHHIAIVCINDDTALGAIGAAESTGRKKDLAVVAVDAGENGRREMRKENTPLVGSTASFPEKYGEKIIPLMLKMLKGEAVPAVNYTDHVFITPENVEQYYPAARDGK